MLDAQFDSHLNNEKHEKSVAGNYRNDHGAKKIKSSFGESEIKVSRDGEGSFEPTLVPKRHNIFDGSENIIISFYAKGMSISDIEEQIKELYDFEIPTSDISRITNAVTSEVVSWQNRPLEDLYLIVWMDGIVFKVRENSKVINKTIYLAVRLNRDGRKEVLGMWLGKNESPAFWMGALTNLKARGWEDILITTTDNLHGFTQTIRSVFPESQTQICFVHQIRNACKYVIWKDRKEYFADMKHIYTSPTKQAAQADLGDYAEKWESKYSYAIASWRNNWD